jgi:hypothetical protein
VIKSRPVKLVGHAAYMREREEVHSTFQSENLDSRDNFGDLILDGSIILKWILKK